MDNGETETAGSARCWHLLTAAISLLEYQMSLFGVFFSWKIKMSSEPHSSFPKTVIWTLPQHDKFQVSSGPTEQTVKAGIKVCCSKLHGLFSCKIRYPGYQSSQETNHGDRGVEPNSTSRTFPLLFRMQNVSISLKSSLTES